MLTVELPVDRPRGLLGGLTPAVAAVGILILVMLASAAVIVSVAHQSRLSDLGQTVIWLCFGLVGVVVAWHQPRNARSTGERRLQLKWLLSGATVFVVAGIALVSLNNPTGPEKVISFLAGVGTFALPVSIGFGILKFRLYDIDRIISRTLAYAIVTGALVGMYAGLVLLATHLLGVHTPVAVAAATLAAAAPLTRSGTGCSVRWTTASTGPGMTRTRRWPPSPRGCRTRWSSTSSAGTCSG